MPGVEPEARTDVAAARNAVRRCCIPLLYQPSLPLTVQSENQVVIGVRGLQNARATRRPYSLSAKIHGIRFRDGKM